jgi:hypothetical protein
MRRFIAGVALGASLFAATFGITVIASSNEEGRKVAVVHGCPQEDSCSIDYTSRGTWVIRLVRP